MDGVLEMMVLDKSILDEAVSETKKTFKDLESKLLDVTNHMPSYTMLSRHANEAIMHAHFRGWITTDEKEHLLTRAKFSSPDSAEAKAIQAWLKSQLIAGQCRPRSFVHSSACLCDEI